MEGRINEIGIRKEEKRVIGGGKDIGGDGWKKR